MEEPTPSKLDAVLREYEQAILDTLGVDPDETLWLTGYLEGMRFWFRKCGIQTREDLEQLLSESRRSFYHFLAHQAREPRNDLRALTLGYYRQHCFDATGFPADFYEWVGRLALCGVTQQERGENRKIVLELLALADKGGVEQ